MGSGRGAGKEHRIARQVRGTNLLTREYALAVEAPDPDARYEPGIKDTSLTRPFLVVVVWCLAP